MDWKEAIRQFLLKRNTVLSRPPGQFNVAEFKLRQIRDRGLDLKVVIDGGAADGWFAYIIRQVYADARIVLIEPRDDAQANLAKLASKCGGCTIVKQLIGSRVGEMEYFEDLDRSSILADVDGKPFGTRKTAQMTTIDALMGELKLVPDLIKLDVQGAELEVLNGAPRSLEAASAVLMEGSLIEFQQGMPLLADLMEYMKARDYRLYDVLALWHRPLDGALAQGDFLFLKNSHSLLRDKRWNKEGQPVYSVAK